MRFSYTIIFYLALPLILLRLLWRSLKAPLYRQRWQERFGFFPKKATSKRTIWLHTVSVGETLAAKPLIESLLNTYSEHQLVITTMTPTGSDQIKKLYNRELDNEKILHSYIPYDLPDCISRFLSRTRPQIAIFMETEVWPNILNACKKNNVANLLINARLSEKSLRGYQKYASLSRQAFSQFSHIVAQTEVDASRIKNLSQSPITVAGSIKSDIVIDHDLAKKATTLKQQFSTQQRKIIIAASTHPGEPEIILQAFKTLLADDPDLLLILVPRHPEQFDTANKLCKDLSFTTIKRSKLQEQELDTDIQIIIGDTMGELMLLYGVADIAIVGGSFIEHGGHNVLEPAAWGKPIISGNSLYNFEKITNDLLQEKGIIITDNASGLTTTIKSLLKNTQTASTMGRNAKLYVEKNRGALTKIVDIIKKTIID